MKPKTTETLQLICQASSGRYDDSTSKQTGSCQKLKAAFQLAKHWSVNVSCSFSQGGLASFSTVKLAKVAANIHWANDK